ncbi:MAG: hypothetical protein CVV64_12680 [Candidatus Wallbacteria bacterium HGW-Wallbacteria-1]|jgi:hypothetical protein|uniref:SRPBCC family protein n=1 Tax=Candidatus Wallbacteria bacterium HGW-Wallbacteria-1 TaxID=2013854 RepID=A0A2N1PN57_9BACT|nr:MAG: hypothetical protein CVV64_12680 [Candidatus Wallbacteria bacterium HGW-Wallbacteria-1]
MSDKYTEKSIKATRTYTQKMKSSAKRVFPLLCPVRELEWVQEWPLEKVFTKSGYAEEDCVFLTRTESRERAIWYITRHEPENYFLEMVKITPSETGCKFQIKLEETGADTCDSTITYTYVALTPKGKEFVESFTDENYQRFMKKWEKMLNNYLEKTARSE